MSVYAQMRGVQIHREQSNRSPTTGQERLTGYVAIPIMALITQQTKNNVTANDRSYTLGSYVLSTYYIDVRKGDKIVDGGDTYSVETVDLPARRGPRTAQLERIERA